MSKTRNPITRHLLVHGGDGRFAGWPANGGIWIWGDEILVGFTLAKHHDTSDRDAHAYVAATARQTFARSRDGGEHWTVEDGLTGGLRTESHDHVLGAAGLAPVSCPGDVDFTHSGFSMLLRRTADFSGRSHFYLSIDRGRNWQGAYAFPSFGLHGVHARTDYLVEGPRTLLAMVTASTDADSEGGVGCARTLDGGSTWQWVSWVHPAPATGFAIMPATIRLPGGGLLCVIRRREKERCWLTAHGSDDNAASWHPLGCPVPDTGRNGSPPALLRLRDGRICLAYAVRGGGPEAPSRICARLGTANGQRWGDEIVLRGGDGANWDVGYPRATQRPDGRVLIVYYYNHVWRDPSHPWCYLAATVWDVENDTASRPLTAPGPIDGSVPQLHVS